MPNALPAFLTNPRQTAAEATPRASWRFRVKTLITDAPAGVTLVKARTYKGSETTYSADDEGATDYIIQLNGKKAVGKVFFATKPEGGTGAKYGTPLKPIVWMESTGGVAVAYCKAKADVVASTGGYGYDATFLANPCNSAGTVEAGAPDIRIRISGNVTHRTWYVSIKMNDVLQYMPTSDDPDGIDVIGTLIGWPNIVGGANGTIMQVQANVGGGAVVFDFLRSHTAFVP